MALSRLVYFSRNMLETSQGSLADRISEILTKSVANNRRDDISGGLLFSRDWFAQVLEGDKIAITQAFARIERDQRHGEATIIEIKPIETRRFDFWWMAAAGVSAETAHLFKRFCGTDRFDPRSMSGELVCNLVTAVLHHQMHHVRESAASQWLSAWRSPDSAGRQDAFAESRVA